MNHPRLHPFTYTTHFQEEQHLGKLQVTLRVKISEIILGKLHQMHMCSDKIEKELAHDLRLITRCSYGFYVGFPSS